MVHELSSQVHVVTAVGGSIHKCFDVHHSSRRIRYCKLCDKQELLYPNVKIYSRIKLSQASIVKHSSCTEHFENLCFVQQRHFYVQIKAWEQVAISQELLIRRGSEY